MFARDPNLADKGAISRGTVFYSGIDNSLSFPRYGRERNVQKHPHHRALTTTRNHATVANHRTSIRISPYEGTGRLPGRPFKFVRQTGITPQGQALTEGSLHQRQR